MAESEDPCNWLSQVQGFLYQNYPLFMVCKILFPWYFILAYTDVFL